VKVIESGTIRFSTHHWEIVILATIVLSGSVIEISAPIVHIRLFEVPPFCFTPLLEVFRLDDLHDFRLVC